MNRVVVVSNRVVSPDDKFPITGGLAVAVVDALKKEKSLWIGWNGKISNNNQQSDTNTDRNGAISTMTWPLTRHDYDGFYRGFSNEVIWPVFHDRIDRMRFDQHDYSAYLYVNQLFARHLAECVEHDDIIWVHDYHFIHLARYCRAAGIRNRIGFFLHIPFPCPALLKSIPVHAELIEALMYYQLLGFQTKPDLQAFRGCLQALSPQCSEQAKAATPRRQPKMGVYPIGIDCDRTLRQVSHRSALQSGQPSLSATRKIKTLISVDRLDYTKGLVERLTGYDTFLERCPSWRGQVVLRQISPLSRGDVMGYQETREAVDRLVGQVNGRWSTAKWSPIHYTNSSIDHSQLLNQMRSADIGLVTSLRDGMNLVAKEYVMVQPMQNPGVLILSEFAGAALELASGALLISPYDAHSIARAIERALSMGLEERRQRHQAMLQVLKRNDLAAWKTRFLGDLRATAR